MADQQTGTAPLSERHYFLVRRLHSLAGLVPVGIFLVIHLLSNAAIMLPGEPGEQFQQQIERIHALGPLLIPVEIVGIFIPLFFHALVGVQIALTSKSNAQYYRHGSNIRYTLQRTTGFIAFVFIIYHLWQMHWMGKPFGGGSFELHAGGQATGAATTAEAIRAAWWTAPAYAIGIVATVFHLANGIWTSLITWGITIRPKTQRASGYACAVFGVALCLVGLGALRGFRTFDIDGRPSVHQATPVSSESSDH